MIRRTACRLLVAVAFVLGLAGHREALAETERSPRGLWLYNAHTGKEIRLRPWRTDGTLHPVVWRRLQRFFRDRHSGARRPVHPRLLRVLAEIQGRVGGRRLQLNSGYRVGGPRLRSYHQVGRAADVHVPGVGRRALFELCRRLPRVGCGYYPRSAHVHVDVRGAGAIWVDLSRSGARARYVRDPRAWLRRHRRSGGSSDGQE